MEDAFYKDFRRKMEREVFGDCVVGEKEYDIMEKTVSLLKKVLSEKMPAKPPFRESLADFNCPVCMAGINFDALNEPPKYAPKFCSQCGCKFDWTPFLKEDEY